MINIALDGFIASLRDAVRSVEVQLAQEIECRKRSQKPIRAAIKQHGPIDLFDIIALEDIKITVLRVDVPVWAKQTLFGGRLRLCTYRRSLWRRPRPYLLSIELKGSGLSEMTASLDGQIFRRGETS
jgi:hypothetical protein